jgi:hypothetical protein
MSRRGTSASGASWVILWYVFSSMGEDLQPLGPVDHPQGRCPFISKGEFSASRASDPPSGTLLSIWDAGLPTLGLAGWDIVLHEQG